jgi:hypothetical protein
VLEEKEKDWWHPSLDKSKCIAKATKINPRGSKCVAQDDDKLPKGLGTALLHNPDTIQQLLRTTNKIKRKSQRSSIKINPNDMACKTGCSTFCNLHQPTPSTSSQRRKTMPTSRKTSIVEEQRRKSVKFELPRVGSIITRSPILAPDGTSAWGSPRGSIEAMTRSGTLDLRHVHSISLPQEKKTQVWPFIGGAPVTTRPTSRYSLMEIHFSGNYGMKKPKNKKYSLRLFMRDCARREKIHKRAEFQEKEHRLWQMGVTNGDKIMPGIRGEDNAYYQHKFHKWAKHVLDRERNLLSYNVIAHTLSDPSFSPGIATSVYHKLQKGPTKFGGGGKPVKSKVNHLSPLSRSMFFSSHNYMITLVPMFVYENL